MSYHFSNARLSRMLDFFLFLFDSLSLFSGLTPRARYQGEPFYWRITGLVLLAFIPGVWLPHESWGDTACLVISIVFGLWLFTHIAIRASLADKRGGK